MKRLLLPALGWLPPLPLAPLPYCSPLLRLPLEVSARCYTGRFNQSCHSDFATPHLSTALPGCRHQHLSHVLPHQARGELGLVTLPGWVAARMHAIVWHICATRGGTQCAAHTLPPAVATPRCPTCRAAPPSFLPPPSPPTRAPRASSSTGGLRIVEQTC